MRRFPFLLLLACLVSVGVLAGCGTTAPAGRPGAASGAEAAGKLFIIGGGTRTDGLLNRLITEANVAPGRGYVVILPMSSSDPDSAIIWSGEDFANRGITTVGFNFRPGETAAPSRLDSLRHASLIYISGGDQARFMAAVAGTPIADAIREAYRTGSVIAGTSAGAAVMSAQMLTGDQRRYPEYTSTYEVLETDNLDLAPGLGLVDVSILVDQHFVARSRYNRLLTAILESPEVVGVGIDESTAILVHGGRAEVVGESQVVVFHNPDRSTRRQNGKLAGRNLRVDIYLPGESFDLE
ncbi:MAG TPA: cyanophycinase [Rhodothermales bacterium]|nr:cyanophycinase [Rhodothermales bacterium]